MKKAISWILTAIVAAAAWTAAIPSHAELVWYKGNLHTHTYWSDGNHFPDMVAAWYKDQGYNFLSLTDHNILSVDPDTWISHGSHPHNNYSTQALNAYVDYFGTDWVEQSGNNVRLKTLPEIRGRLEVPGEFLMIQGEEITDGRTHVNAVNLGGYIPPQGARDARERMHNNQRAVAAQEATTGAPILNFVNHPNFQWELNAEDLAAIRGDRLFEVYNAHTGVNHLGDATRPGVEHMWDIANTLRLTLYRKEPLLGVATDDAHHYHGTGETANPGRGWVMVQADALTPESLITAMRAGDFYSSSGATLDNLHYDNAARRLELSIQQQSGENFTTQFIGTLKGSSDPGVVLAEVSGTNPSYQLTGDELYVRAVVTSSAAHPNPTYTGQQQQAWTQPVGWSIPDPVGLIGHWTFDDNAARDGAVVNQAQPGAGDGVVRDGAYTSGGMLHLGGGGDHVAIADHPIFDAFETANQLTIAAWVRPDTLSGRPAIFSTRSENAPGSFQLEAGTGDGGSNRLAATSVNHWAVETPNNALTPGEWAHVAFTRDGDVQKLYVNGVEQTLVTNNLLDFRNNPHDKLIGAGTSFQPSHYFRGRIAEVAIYDEPLTPTEFYQELHLPAAPTRSDGPTLWLDADHAANLALRTAGDSQYVEAWFDRSSNYHLAHQYNHGRQPELVADAINGRPALRLDGDDRFDSNFIPERMNEGTIIAVVRTTQTRSHILSQDPSGYNNLDTLFGVGKQNVGIDSPGRATFETHGPSNNVINSVASTTNVADGNVHIISARIDGTSYQAYVDGVLESTATSSEAGLWGADGNTRVWIGRHSASTSNMYVGDMAEILVYDRALNTAERQIVDNYLGVKYGVDLPAGYRVYGNDDYYRDIFGVGRVDEQNLVTDAWSAGLAIRADGLADPDAQDDAWLLAGHNSPGNAWTTDDVPAGLTHRWERVWYLEEAGDVGEVELAFDFHAGGGLELEPDGSHYLLYSPTNAYNFDIFANAGVGLINLEGQMVTFGGLAGLPAGYYTLGVPEPGSLMLLLGAVGLLLVRRRRVSGRALRTLVS